MSQCHWLSPTKCSVPSVRSGRYCRRMSSRCMRVLFFLIPAVAVIDAEYSTAECEYLTEGGQHRRVDMSLGRSIERQYDQHAAEHRHQDGEQELDICEDFLKHTGG